MSPLRLWLAFAALVAACGEDAVVPNLPPVLLPLSFLTPEDTAAERLLEASDPEDDPLTITLGGPTHGTVARDGLRIQYVPFRDFVGDDALVVSVSDGEHDIEGTIDIDVAPVNDAPVGMRDAFRTPRDTPLVLAPATLLENDHDVEGDRLTIPAVGSTSTGSVAFAGAEVVYTPPPGYEGDATFAYTLSDGLATARTEVTITVGDPN